MRDTSRERIERLVQREGHGEVTLAAVEAGLAEARQAMSEAMRNRGGESAPEGGAEAAGPGWTLPWDAEAEAMLERVPEGFMRELTAQRMEARAQRLGHPRITAQGVREHLESWQRHSEQVVRELEWEGDAYAQIASAPPVVKGMIIREVEAGARRDGLERVTADYVRRARRAWQETGLFHVAPTEEY